MIKMENPQGGFIWKIGKAGSRDPEGPGELKDMLAKVC
jgi:hypothetical protein